MKNFLVKVTFLSPLSTPLHSDTLFGCICWAMRYIDGEKELEDFLNSFPETPLLISNGFPAGKIPRPIVPPISRENARKVINRKIVNPKLNLKQKLALGLQCLKKLKKRQYLDIGLFKELRGAYSEKFLLEKWLTSQFIESVKTPKPQIEAGNEDLLPHNSINRITTRPLDEGGLFFTEANFFDKKKNPEDGCFDLYLATERFDQKKLETYFNLISATGFGKDASTGKGHFKFKIQEADNDLFNFSGNRFMTLSNGTFGNDVREPYYQTLTKYGKLGGHWAMDETNPFKKPIFMVQAGSTFQAEGRKSFYGELLSRVHKHREEVRHYGCLYPVMFNLEE